MNDKPVMPEDTSHESARTTTSLIIDALGAHDAALRRFVAARVPQADIDDIMQSAALRAVEKAHALRDAERVVPWLYRIHRNIITDALRKEASQQRTLDAQPPSPEPTLTMTDEDRCVCSLVLASGLSPDYAEVLALVDVQGASRKEAAQTLGISVNNATVRLQRARKALRKAMQEHCGVLKPEDCIDCRCVYDGCCEMSRR